MNKREKQILALIQQYESGKLAIDDAVSQINEIATFKITAHDIRVYDSSESVKDFVRRIAVNLIPNPKDLTDEQALELIKEMKADVCNDAMLHRNDHALAMRYRKPEGTIIHYVFHRERRTPEEILKELKIDTVIYL